MIDVNAIQVPVAAISRHRLMTDGDGVTTLVVLHSCPLRCRWCLESADMEGGIDLSDDDTDATLYSCQG